MKKLELDLLHSVQKVQPTHPLLAAPPKTPQQHFLLTYLSLKLLDSFPDAQLQAGLLAPLNGCFSQLLLLIKYMRKCVDKGSLLNNSSFHVLNTLILWMAEQEKPRNPKAGVLQAVLLPHPSQLAFQQFEELIVYVNYIAADLIKIVKGGEVEADELLNLLEVIIPRVYYNIILTLDSLGIDSSETEDVLFYNQSLEYFTRTNTNYKALCRVVLKQLISMPLKQNQMRDLLQRACRFYLLFWKDQKQPTELFLAAFQKATEAARFSLTDEFVLFFKVISKLGETSLQKIMRGKYEWIDELLGRFGKAAVVGHPKGEVNPFNLLDIRQGVKVEAGKTAHRIIEIYNDYSLFYFKVDIEAHDISVRLFYLGQFESKVQVKKLLLTQEKVSNQLRSAFVAAKKGLYMIEFDNTYSWINGKSLKFEYILLAQYKHREYPPWMNSLFELASKDSEKKEQANVEKQRLEKKELQRQQERREEAQEEQYEQEEQEDEEQDEDEQEQQVSAEEQRAHNKELKPKQQHHPHQEHPEVQQMPQQMPQQPIPNSHAAQRPTFPMDSQQKARVLKVEQPKVETAEVISSNSLPSQQDSDRLSWGQANLSLIDSIFSLLVNIHDHTYQFQTNLQDRIAKRLKAYCEGEDKLHWIFNSEARDWLKRHGFIVTTRNNSTLLRTSEQVRHK